jgi:hypothetical protein
MRSPFLSLFSGISLIWGFAGLPSLSGQAVPPPGRAVASPRPMDQEAGRLQHIYGKVVTYEDPVYVWREELRPLGRRFSPSAIGFFRPADSGSEPSAEAALRKILDAYHQQTTGPRFQIVASAYGLHIVPLQVHDERGQFVPARNLLDASVDVLPQERTATEHFRALCATLGSFFGMDIHYFDGSLFLNNTTSFEQHFAAQPARFTWGTNGLTARDAVIGLLERSATTYSWSLRCEEGETPKDRMCVFNITPVEVAIKDAAGRSFNTTLQYDRCPKCAPSLSPRNR